MQLELPATKLQDHAVDSLLRGAHPGKREASMAKFSAAIFDMDGLLLDSERPIRDAWIQVCTDSGAPIDNVAYQGAIGRNASDSKAHIMSVCGPGFDYQSATAKVASILETQYGQRGYPLKDGALEILAWLRSHGIPLAVASSTSHQEVGRRLRAAEIAGFFDAIAGGDEVEHGKPAPDLYLLANERMARARPDQCIVFEDSEPGAEAALAAGMRVVIVPDLRPPSAAVTKRSAATVTSLRDAIALCKSWLGDS